MIEGEKIHVETNIPGLKLYSRGKVRDTWELSGSKKLLVVATDRISAFDVVVGAIPNKGKILTKMSEFWFRFLSNIVANHFISADLSFANNHSVWSYASQNDLEGRTMIVKKAEVIPNECVVRGYLAGSGWQEYQETGEVCGIRLPPSLKEGDKLPNLIFTPATKAEAGMHDENITYDQMTWKLHDWLRDKEVKTGEFIKHGSSLAFWLRHKSLKIYEKAAAYAASRGIIIADTKLEFGLCNGEPILVDELLTPDSSRFWPADKWQPGRPQESFDKQFLRDWLTKEAKWNKHPPAPELPQEVIKVTRQKYQEALERLVG